MLTAVGCVLPLQVSGSLLFVCLGVILYVGECAGGLLPPQDLWNRFCPSVSGLMSRGPMVAVRAAVGLRLQEDEGAASAGAGIPPLIFAKMFFFFFFL